MPKEKKAPPNLPDVSNRVRLRGRDATGTLEAYTDTLWARVKWDEGKSGPQIVHLHELEKVIEA